MSRFELDTNESADENIERYFDYLNEKDAELAKILKDEIGRLIPLPTGTQRTAARSEFNAEVARRLDSLDADDSQGVME